MTRHTDPITTHGDVELAREDAQAEPIAVIGIGCRFPGGANSPEAYWSLLTLGESAISEVPADRFSVEAFFDPNPEALGTSTTKWGGFIDDVRSFDPAYFDISPREAQSMDPQQRLLLEVVVDAIQDGGLKQSELQQRLTGVFVGVSTTDYGVIQRRQRTRSDVYAGTGGALSIVANRISHRLNLTGPSNSVDTACSSSLVAIDQAVTNLQNGRCDVALAGGVNVLADPGNFVMFSKAGMMSTTGTISTFDERANGYVRGEGAGIVVLKRLSDAVRDGDPIRAVIRATCVNQDGRTSTLTAPNGDAQSAMLSELCRRADVAPEAVDYVEAHGTGTPVGDPIEAHAIGNVFGRGRNDGPVTVGSVKPVIGHLESAAGISGLIKTVLCVDKGQVPPNANFREPNPNIPFDALGIAVPQEVMTLPKDRPNLAVVNSFGFGGTNASALLESYAQPVAEPVAATTGAEAHVVLPISGATEASLAANAGALADALTTGHLGDAELGDIAQALSTTRDAKPYRAGLVAANKDDAITRLRQLAADDVPPPVRGQLPEIVTDTARKRGKVAFTFAGQGGQWWGMARSLLETNGPFRQAFDAYDEVFADFAGWSVRAELLKDEATTRVNQSLVAQPTIFGVQIALAAWWEAHGVRPDMVLGHSFGEAAASYVAGALDIESAARLIGLRAQTHSHVSREGGMMAVGMSPDDLFEIIGRDSGVEIAAYNGPASCTATGPAEALEAAFAKVQAANPDTLLRRLVTDTAWHSSLLDEVHDWFHETVGAVEHRNPSTTFISTVTGKPEVALDLGYWWRNLRQPVRYRRAVEMALDLGADTFIELSPHRVLSGLTSGIAANRNADVVLANSLIRGEPDLRALGVAQAQLYCAGSIDQTGPKSPRRRSTLRLPSYQWDRQPYWHESEEAHAELFDAKVHPLLGHRKHTPAPEWANEFNLASDRYLTGHAVEGEVVFPAAGYLDMMLAAARDALGEGTIELTDVDILAALFIREGDNVLLHTHLDLNSSRIAIRSRVRDGSDAWVLRAQGRARITDAPLVTHVPEIETETAHFDHGTFYARTEQHGLVYRGAFQNVRAQSVGALIGEADLEAPAEIREGLHKHVAHPALLDGILQTVVTLSDDEAETELYLPVRIAQLRLGDCLPETFSARTQLRQGKQVDRPQADYAAYDGSGVLILTVDGLEMQALERRKTEGAAEDAPPRHVVEQFIEVPLPDGEDLTFDGSDWLVIGGDQVAADVITTIEAHGGQAQRFDVAKLASGDAEVLRDVTDHWRSAGELRCGVVFAEGAAGPDLDGQEDQVTPRVEQLTNAMLAVGRAFKSLEDTKLHPELVVLTRGARVHPAESTAFGATQTIGASQVGLSRTLANECAASRVLSIDVDPSGTLDALPTLMRASTPETEWVLRGETAYVPRLRSMKREDLPRRLDRLDLGDPASNVEVTMPQPGSIDALVLNQTEVAEPGEHQVLVRTRAVGLNFRDVMAVTGLLPADAETEPAWLNLGLEYAGEIEAVGPGVDTVKPGDRVMAIGSHCLQARQVADARGLIRMPDGVSFAGAATIPSVFSTAWYALRHVGRLAPGERVLIHLATGGVGLAAIQIAKALGAEIYATAGSEEKRAYLRDLGISHIYGSRSLAFADEIIRDTGGEGVDVVLNALPGPYIEKGIGLLRPFGRFLEIGKRDVYGDTPLGMKSLHRNLSFNVIDLAAMGRERPEMLGHLMQEVVDEFSAGRLTPIPHTLFDASDVKGAFTTMSKARHIGKIVVGFEHDELEVPARVDQSFAADPNGVYLVTGGSRGFGVAIAEWLSEAGAGEIALASRSGAVDEAQAPRISEIEGRGTRVSHHKVDMTDPEDVARVLQELSASGRRLAGIVHGAAVIKDGFIDQLTPELVADVIRPKVAGAMNLLHGLETLDLKPDFFVSFSSVAQMIGSIGQANYVAANAFLDGFAQMLRARGINGLTIDWGALGESGFVARSDAMGRYLKSMGMEPVSDEEAVAGLEQALFSDVASVAFARVDWASIGRMLTAGGVPPRLSDVVTARDSGAHQIRAELASVPQEDWPGIVGAFLLDEVAAVLGIEREALDEGSGLLELGFDSLSSIELKNRLEGKLGLALSVGSFLSASTLTDVTTLLVDGLVDEARAAASTTSDDSGQGSAEKAPDSDTFQPAARQVDAIAQASASMTTPNGRRALEHAGYRRLSSGVGIEDAKTAWQGLAETFPLTALTVADGELTIGDAAPAAAVETDIEAALGRPLDPGSGALLRAFISVDGETLGLCLHDAIGDEATLIRLLDGWAARAEGREGLPAPAQAELFATLRRASGKGEDPASQNDLAYWRAVGTPAVPALALPGRRLALAPVGFGQNRDQTVLLSADLETSDRADADWVYAFATTLAETGDRDDVVLTLASSKSDSALPWAQEVPIFLRGLKTDAPRARTALDRQLERASRHADFDIAAFEANFAPALLEAGSVPRQFGVRIHDGSADSATRVLLSPSAHDACLHISKSAGQQRVSLAVDLGAMDEAAARAMFLDLLDRVPGMTAAPANIEMQVISALENEEGDAPEAPALAGKAEVYPAIPSAQVVMSALTAPSTTATFVGNWVVNQALRVRPGLDAKRLGAAVDELVARHETLRMRYGFDGETVDAIIEPNSPNAFSVRDLSASDPDDIIAAVHAAASEPIDFEAGPLFSVTLFKGGTYGDVVLLHMTEFAGDGWSVALVLDGLIRTYVGMDAGAGAGTRYEDLLAAMAPPDDPDELAASIAHWHDVLHPAVPQARFGRVAKGLPMATLGAIAPYELRRVSVSKPGLEGLTTWANRLGVNQNALIGAAVMQTVADWSGAETLYMGSVHPLRNDPALIDKVAFLSARLPVRCDIAEAGGLDALARQLQMRFTENNRFARPGIAFDAPKQMPDGAMTAQADWSLFGYGRVLPENLYKNSMAAPLLEASGGQTLSVGGLEFAGLEMPPYGLTRGDFNLRPMTTANGVDLNLFHDLLSLTPEEADRFLGDILGKLELDNAVVSEIERSGPVGDPDDLASVEADAIPQPRPLKPRSE